MERKTGAQKLLHVPRAAVSIVGGIQPEILKRALGREHLHDGLCARLLLAMPKPQPVRWSEETIRDEVDAALNDVVDKLIALEPAVDQAGQPVPRVLSLSKQAKALWVQYFNRHRAEMAGLDEDLAAAWSKLEAYTARFALIFQLCSYAADEPFASAEVIDEISMRSAIELSDWFGGQARKVYGRFKETPEERRNRKLFEHIRRHGGSVTARDIQRRLRQYPTADAAEAALTALVEQGFGRWEQSPSGHKGGPPKQVFRIIDVADVDTTSQNAGNLGVVSALQVKSAELAKGPQERDSHLNNCADVDTTSQNTGNNGVVSAPMAHDVDRSNGSVQRDVQPVNSTDVDTTSQNTGNLGVVSVRSVEDSLDRKILEDRDFQPLDGTSVDTTSQNPGKSGVLSAHQIPDVVEIKGTDGSDHRSVDNADVDTTSRNPRNSGVVSARCLEDSVRRNISEDQDIEPPTSSTVDTTSQNAGSSGILSALHTFSTDPKNETEGREPRSVDNADVDTASQNPRK